MREIVKAAREWADDQTATTRAVLLDEEAVARRPILRKQSNLLRAVMAMKKRQGAA